jgi:polyhydroxybutyrate depolymerase
VMMVHGYGVNGVGQDILFPVSNALKERRFVYVLPNGTVDSFGKRFWNATDACCDFGRIVVDDVSFLRAVIDDVKSKYPIDPKRVYLVSHSNGGFMSLRMACEASDVVTGVVSVAGAAWLDFSKCPSAGPPVSVLQIHGTRDDSVLYQGNERYPSALGTVQRFAQRNGCTGAAQVADALDIVGDSVTETKRETFQGCPKAGAVELWSIENGSHLPFFNKAWPTQIFDWLEANAR